MARNVSKIKIDAAIQALLSMPTVTAAAEAVKVSRRTMSRWLQDTDFQQRLQQARRDLLQHGSGRLCGLLNDAITIIGKGLAGEKINKSSYLCAKLTIEACRAISEDALLARVEALEQQALDQRLGRDRELEAMSLPELQERLRQLRSMQRKELEEDDRLLGDDQ